jgi:hypothetical protein
MPLSLDEWQGSEILPVQVKQIERDEDTLGSPEQKIL